MRRIAAVMVAMVMAGCGGGSAPEPPTADPPASAPGEGSSLVDIELDGCDAPSGTVTNGQDYPVNVYVTVAFLDADGVRIGDDFGSVQALAAGGIALWEVAPAAEYATCEIASVEAYPA